MPERLFDDDSCAPGTIRFRQLFDDGLKQNRRNRQVMCRTLCVLELLAKRRESRRVLIVAVHVAQQAHQLFESGGIDAAMLLKAVLALVLEADRDSILPWPLRRRVR